jgi:hypothetical protein
MPEFESKKPRPYSILVLHLRRTMTTRLRRIILVNILCLLLFLTAIGFMYKSRNRGPQISAERGLHAGEVYYISKRALCARSIAYEQLGIQPIAVSKVILRPIVRWELSDGYGDRLEVLDKPMVNDVRFLDRNVSGNEAELSTMVCPLHTVSILPDRKPTRYAASSIVFGVTMRADDIPKALKHWRYWAWRSSVTFHILLPSSDHQRIFEAQEIIRKGLGINVLVESARETNDFGKLTLLLVERMQKRATKVKKWFIILTSDTFVTSVDDILLALEPHDSNQLLYMGGLSESSDRKEKFGVFAYGGAGIVLSQPSLENIASNSTFPQITSLKVYSSRLSTIG